MVRVIIAILIAGFIGLVALGYWTDRGTKDGVPVNSGNSVGAAVSNTPDYQATIAALQTAAAGGPQTPDATNTPAAAAPTAQSSAGACLGSAKFNLAAPDTLTLANPGFMVVDYYHQGEPQGVTVLPFPTANMVYDLEGSVLGAYWIYPASCDMDVLVNQAIAHADQLKGEGYNITGYKAWADTGVFTKK